LIANAKAEAYWCLLESFERGAIKGLTDEEMQAQLAGIRYRHTSSGRIEIESKDREAKKPGLQSPDRAEALVLAFARAVPRQQTVALSVPVSISPI
jgi:phage terminase large subunit